MGLQLSPIISSGSPGYDIRTTSELVTIAAGNGAGGVVTSGNLAPNDSLIMGVVARVTQAPGGGATTFDVGVTGSGNVDSLLDGISTANGTTANSAADNDGTQLPLLNDAATTLTITTDGNVTGASLIVRLIVFYNQFTEPTS